VTAGGKVTETSTGGKVTVNSAMNAAGNISLDANKSLNTAAAGDIKSTSGSVTLHGVSNMTLAGDVISQGGTDTLTSSGAIAATGTIAAKNGVSVTSSGDAATLSTLGSNNGPITVNAHDDI